MSTSEPVFEATGKPTRSPSSLLRSAWVLGAAALAHHGEEPHATGIYSPRVPTGGALPALPPPPCGPCQVAALLLPRLRLRKRGACVVREGGVGEDAMREREECRVGVQNL